MIPIKFNYIRTAGFQPRPEEALPHEIIVNEADGILWLKTSTGEMLRVGGDTRGYITTIASDANDEQVALATKAYTDTALQSGREYIGVPVQ